MPTICYPRSAPPYVSDSGQCKPGEGNINVAQQNPLGNAASGLGTAVSNAAALGGLIPDTLKDPTFWKRFGLVGAGVLAVVLGAILLISKPAEKVSTTTGKLVA